MIGFGQEEIPVSSENNYCNYLYINKISQKNIFTILVNSQNQLLAEGELVEISQLKDGAERFINNNGRDFKSSEKAESAFFLIESRGSKTIDYEIIAIINRIYAEINIEINQRKICYVRDSEIGKYRSRSFLPPPPPEVIKIVEDKVEIENEIEDTESDEDEEIEIINEDDEVFMVVESMPIFPCLDFSFTNTEGLLYTKNYCGDEALMKFVQKNVKYPSIAKEYNITGKVYASFIVGKDGSVTNVKIVRGVDKNLDAEVIRLVKSFPKYKAGIQRGKAVRVMFTIPINFTLN
jgi:TonB family protein